MLGLGVGHHDHQTLRQLTSFYGYFLNKKSKAITLEAWRTFTIIVDWDGRPGQQNPMEREKGGGGGQNKNVE
jgi:hypothetical protein